MSRHLDKCFFSSFSPKPIPSLLPVSTPPISVMSGSWGKPLTIRSELSPASPTITEKNIPDLSNRVRSSMLPDILAHYRVL